MDSWNRYGYRCPDRCAMLGQFGAVDSQFGAVNARFDDVHARIDDMNTNINGRLDSMQNDIREIRSILFTLFRTGT